EAAFEAAAAASSAHQDCELRYQSVAHNSAASAAANTASVMGVACKYSMLGLSANSNAAVVPAAAEAYKRRAAANRNHTASTKPAAEGRAPATPPRHHASRIASGIISTCGR